MCFFALNGLLLRATETDSYSEISVTVMFYVVWYFVCGFWRWGLLAGSHKLCYFLLVKGCCCSPEII